jgi:pimeloyl-ACP methyl ester carboxylesterase
MVGELRDLQANQPWHADDINCPVMLGHGSHGAEHHRVGMGHVHDRLPQSELVELAECRHDAPLSHSELFTVTIVEPLLRRVGGEWAAALSVRAAAP